MVSSLDFKSSNIVALFTGAEICRASERNSVYNTSGFGNNYFPVLAIQLFLTCHPQPLYVISKSQALSLSKAHIRNEIH